MTILVAFDTVFGQCSLAVASLTDKLDILYHQTVAGNRGQTEIILPMLDVALNQTKLDFSQVDAWVFNRGPGAFSGIRINTAVVQALSVANNAPCIGISSLMALADTAYQQHHFTDSTHLFCAIDARQNQVYLGKFYIKDGQVMPLDDTTNAYYNEYLVDYYHWIDCDILVGDGADLLNSNAKKIDVYPTAVDLARLGAKQFLAGERLSAEEALPVYLRDNAWKTLAQQQGKT